MTLTNEGSSTPDAFYCYVDGSNRCDEDQSLPAPGTSSTYTFGLASAPDILSVTAYFAYTAPSDDRSFTSVGASPSILVRMSEFGIYATCTSGCTLQ